MVKAVFSEEMKEMLKSMKGKTFKSYEGEPFHFRKEVEFYGAFRINLGRESFEISNLLELTKFPGSVEEVSRFKCKKVGIKSEYIPYMTGPHFLYMVNERIKSVALVKDTVSVDNGDYEIEFDMALVIRTTHSVYTFTRDWFYDETISVIVDPHKEKPFELQRELEQWKDIQDVVEISRRTEEL